MHFFFTHNPILPILIPSKSEFLLVMTSLITVLPPLVVHLGAYEKHLERLRNPEDHSRGAGICRAS